MFYEKSDRIHKNMHETDPWTTALAIIVSIAAIVIGYSNFVLFLEAVDLINTRPSHPQQRLH